MSEYNIYFDNNPIKGKIWIRGLPAKYYIGPIEEQLGIQIAAPSLMRISKLFDYDPMKLADMDHKTFDELRYVDIT